MFPVCAALGVQVKTPVLESITAPAGAVERLKESVWAGRSWSVAEAVKKYGCSSLTVALAGTPFNTGAVSMVRTIAAQVRARVALAPAVADAVIDEVSSAALLKR